MLPGVRPESFFANPPPTMPDPGAMAVRMTGANDRAAPIHMSPDDEKFTQLKEWVEEGRDRSEDWRREAEQDLDMVAGWQWSDEDMQILDQGNRPVVTFNRAGRNVDLITGMESQGRQEVSYLPREEGDVEVSEVLTSGVQYITDETDAAQEKSDAFRDLVITGLGWTNTVMNYRDWDNGMPEESWINCLEMYWDTHAHKRNLKDSRWRARARTAPTNDYMVMFPDADPGQIHAAWMGLTDDPNSPSEPDRQTYSYENSPTHGRPSIMARSTVVEIQWWEVVKKAIVDDVYTGERKEMPAGRFSAIARAYPGRYVSVTVERKEFFRAFLGGSLLGKQRLEGLKDFTFQPMTGKRDRRVGWYGLVRAMRDPQRWANKWLSQSMHIMNTGAKNTVLFEEGSLIDGRKAQEAWQRPGAWIELARGAIANNRVRVQEPATLPPDLANMMHFALQSIQDCVGVNSEMLGMSGGTDANKAALLEHERRKAGLTLMAVFFDAKRLFVKRQGRLLLNYMMRYMNDGRLIRIVNEGTKKHARLLLQGKEQDLEYDVIVDEAPDSPNMKEKTWSTIVAMLPMLERLQPPASIWPKVLRYSPLPVSLVNSLDEEVKKIEEQNQPTPEQQAMMQAQLANLQAMAQKAAADAQKSAAQAERERATVSKIGQEIGEIGSKTYLNMAKAQEIGPRLQLDIGEQIRETIAMDDARELGKLTVHENA